MFQPASRKGETGDHRLVRLSGDTGSAAESKAVRGLDNGRCVYLFPMPGVDVQRRQMTTPSESNVHALALDGDFTIVRRVWKICSTITPSRRVQLARASNQALTGGRVLAADSLLLLPQACHGRVGPQSQLYRCLQATFGDIFAGYIAPLKWGFADLPICGRRPQTRTTFCTAA